MRPVKTIQKYKCDFCKKRSVKHVIAIHEKRCYRNPNRYCDNCNNTGETKDGSCIFCDNFDEKQLKQIKEREEKSKKETVPDSGIPLEEVPF